MAIHSIERNLQNKRFDNIQALRGLAIFLVILFHISNINNTFPYGINSLPKFSNVGAAGVDIFFVISGFIISSITRGKFQNSSCMRDFILHRIARIYPLYWFYLFIVLAHIFLVYLIRGAHQWEHSFYYWQNFLLWPHYGELILPVSWTLSYEIYFYGVMTLLLFFPERWFIKLTLLWAVIIYGLHSFINPVSQAYVVISSTISLEFIAGCLIARMPYLRLKQQNYLLLASGIALLFIGYYYFQIDPKIIHSSMESIRVVMFGIPSMLIVYATVGLEFNQIKLPSVMIKFGDASYTTYLSHLIILTLLARLWMTVHYHSITFAVIMLSVMFASVICYGFIGYHYIEKPMISFFRNKIQSRMATEIIKSQ